MAANGGLKVAYFQRRPRSGYSFSLEFIFADVRERLVDKIDSEVKISRFYNDAAFSKVYNIVEAAFRQSRSINHITGELHFLDLLMRKRTVVLTILDCVVMDRKTGLAKFLVKLIYLTLPVRRARYITAISEETKRQIIGYTGCAPEKISVIPVAIDPMFEAYPKEFNTLRPVILHIGTGYNKNLFRLIDAIAGMDCELRIIGRVDDDQIKALEKNSITYSHAHSLSQSEMLEEYRKCDILAFVSIFEGFGMPILEANAVERAVITSNISSMPEIAGAAAHLVDPFDREDIRKGILKLISDAEYRNYLIEKGRKNWIRYDPESIAGSYLDLYRKIAGDTHIRTNS